MMMIVRLLIPLLFLITCAQAIHLALQNEPGGKYCLVMDADIGGSVQYFDSNLKKLVDYPFVVNGTTTVSGKCWDNVIHNQTTETMEIHFFPNDITPSKKFPSPERWAIKLSFVRPADTVFKILDYELKAIFYSEHFNTTTIDKPVFYYKAADAELEWGASDNHGFTCSSSDLKLKNNSEINFGDLKVLTFALLPNDQFPSNQLFEQCKLDVRTSDLVPIIVGACLAGLVIIVLVAYLIGRARAKRQGYASV